MDSWLIRVVSLDFPSSRAVKTSLWWSWLLKKIFFYLFTFIFGCAGSSWLLAGFSLVATSSNYSLVAVHRLHTATASLVVEHKLWDTRVQWLQLPGSRVQAQSLCMGSVACGVFSDQGSTSCLLHWQADSLPLSHQGSPEMGIVWSLLRELRSFNALLAWTTTTKRRVAAFNREMPLNHND